MSRTYLAARYSRRHEMQGYAAELRAAGHQMVCRWVQGDGLPEEDSDEDLRIHGAGYAAMDLADICAAELVILFTDAASVRGGTDVEFGIAIPLEKALWVVGPPRNPFHYLPQVQRFDTWEEALEAL